ncbi:MAG: hypothetical protein HOC23_20945 [Halieaceae bacterium]|nr:hypothetical protein [Halieaceae bacterium]
MTLPKTTPWTLRIFDALPGSPSAIGLSFAAVLLIVFFVVRTLFDGGTWSTAGDLRLALIHILLTAYTATAYAYLLSTTKKTAQDLFSAVKHDPQWQAIADSVGTHLRWGLILAAGLGVLIDVLVTDVTTVGSEPWVWSETNHDARWMRILGPFFSAWMSCLIYVLLVESARLSRLSDSIRSLELLDLEPYKPLVRQGLTNALLVVGMTSVLSLFLLEPGFIPLLIRTTITFAVIAWIGLMLPLRGIRKKIRMAKEKEQAWCRQALISARNQLKSGTSGQQPIAEIIAYQSMIESIRNWPFDNPTLTRFALYLLIPLGSMFGGALVERGLELFLF